MVFGNTARESARFETTLSGLFTGGVLSVLVLIASLSFGSLIFSGDLAHGVSDGIGVALISASIGGLVIAWKSSHPAILAIPQDRTAPILALMAAQIVTVLPANTSAEDKLVNVLAAIALTSLLAGVALYLLGHYRLGNLTRFIPYPVIGGFLAGSGWLLVGGSLRVTTGLSLTLANFPALSSGSIVARWLPAAGLGLTLFLTARVWRKSKLVPLFLLGSLPAFYCVLALSAISPGEARAAGWLPELPPGNGFHLHLWSLEALKAINFPAMLSAAGLAATAIVTAALSILLNSSALELAVHQEIDLNRELRAAGIANLAGGLAGGMLGFQSLSLSRLAHDLGAGNRLPTVFAALICGLAMLAGPSAFALLPKFALGAMLLYLGLGFLAEHLYDSWRKLPLADYAVVVMIVAVMASVGYLEGVGVGVLAAIFLFIHNYSRVGVITHALTGAELQSNVDRPVTVQRVLHLEGGRLHLLKLQGFIFFGTANSLLNSIRNRIRDRQLPRLGCVILDFRRVSGVDSSAALSLAKAIQLAFETRFELLFTQVPEDMMQHLQRSFIRDDRSGAARFFPDLDHALEWWEEQVIAEQQLAKNNAPDSLRAQLLPLWPSADTLDSFLTLLQDRRLQPGEYLIRQGEAAEEIYFIEHGEVSTVLESADGGAPRRLRRQGAGTVLGELGLLLNQPRSASVIVNQPTKAKCLSKHALAALKSSPSQVATDFFEFLARYLSERVINTTKSLRVLAD